MPESGGVQAWQTLCYDTNIRPPERFCGAVYYQIFPDRFYQQGECDLKDKLTPFWIHQDKRETPQYLPDEHGEIKNNDYYGGNLRGICAKLDYLASIGTEVIYLNPIFMAFSNHRYDTADYKRVDPMPGTEQDFRGLCSAAHELGMKIILDGVFSHTGSNSVYFDQHGHFGGGAANDPDSPYREWYRFSRYPDEYESWWGIRTLPCVDELNPGYLDFVVTGENSVVRQWLRLGADGYRLDVADELPDEFLEILYRTVKEEKPDAVVLGEVWEDASNKVSYGARRKYLRGKQLDGVMNYVYRGAIIDFVTGTISAETFLEEVMQLAENYPKETLDCSMNLLSTHDTGRILTMLAGPDGNRMSRDERAAARLDKKQVSGRRAAAVRSGVPPFYSSAAARAFITGTKLACRAMRIPLTAGFTTGRAGMKISVIFTLSWRWRGKRRLRCAQGELIHAQRRRASFPFTGRIKASGFYVR